MYFKALADLALAPRACRPRNCRAKQQQLQSKLYMPASPGYGQNAGLPGNSQLRPSLLARGTGQPVRWENTAKCGGLAGRAELLSGAEGASSRPVRKIVLRE